MKKVILIIFLMVVLFNYFNGCIITRTEKITNNFTKDKINEVVLTNYEQIHFDYKGGKYVVHPSIIKGFSYKGIPYRVDLDSVKEIRESNLPSIEPDDLAHKNITEIITNRYKLIEFDSAGAVYNKRENMIEGNNDQGIPQKIPVDEAWQIHTVRPTLVSLSDLAKSNNLFIAQIVDRNNWVYIFDKHGGKLVKKHSAITGVTREGVYVEVNPDSILYANVTRTNVAESIFATTGIVLAVAVGIGVIIVATKESCPFVYSYIDGKYVFDAEPLGGATSMVLERTEYSRMEHLKEVNNKYKIMVRNEVEETQYINEMSLLCIKHDPDKQVYPGINGNFYQIKDPIKPLAAFDEKGTDLKKVVSYDDQLFWQTKMPVNSYLLNKNYRQTLTFVFPKPDTAKTVKLIINAGTSLWGSRMIKEMLQLYGNYIDTWYSKINQKGMEYYQMMNFINSEELYQLKIYVKNNNSWIEKSLINGGGPLISETRVYNLDISDIKGDSLIIKCNPPYGFWTVNYTAVEYNYFSTPAVETIPLIEAIANSRTDIKDKIISSDSIYQVMPNVGDQFFAVYKAEGNNNEIANCYFLKTTGYYKIHIDKNRTLQFDRLSSLTKPGEIVRWSNENYQKWVNGEN